jgi:lysyl-tRNA synthetase class 2
MRVAGRVLACEGAEVWLGDAFTKLLVHCSEDPELLPGFWVVFVGTWDGTLLKNATLASSQVAPTPTSDSEFARLAWQGIGSRLEQRAQALKLVRQYFDDEGFLEVETPTRLRAPGLDAHVEPIAAGDGWLVTSPELHLKRLIVGGMPRVFELARCHRGEELGAYHEPEFTLLEWYRSLEPVESVMRDTEQLVRGIVTALSGQSVLRHREFTVSVAQPFARITVAEALERFAQVPDGLTLAERDPDRWFRLWVEKVEPAIAAYEVPVFVVDYPLSQAALARKKPDNPRVAERFELYCAGVELCNGYGELTDANEQQARFETELLDRRRRNLPDLPLDQRFLAAMRERLPTCSGNALGFDRLVMLATGAECIADVMAFPWDRN